MLAEKTARWILNHQKTVVLTLLLSAFVLSLGLMNWQVTGNQRAFFTDDDPDLVKLRAIETSFSSSQNAIIVFEALEQDIFTRENLALIHEVTEKSWRVPHSLRVDSISNYRYTRAQEDDLFVEPLIEDAWQLTTEQLKAKREYAISQHEIVNYLVSPDASVAAVHITLNISEDNLEKERAEAMSEIETLVANAKLKTPKLNIRLTGLAPSGQAFPRIIRADAMTVFPIAGLLIVLCLGLILRDLFSTLVCVLVIILAVSVGVGSVLWSGVKVTPVVTSAPVIILILALADCIHLLVNFRQSLQRGLDKNQALLKSLTINMKPVILTSLTTAASFFALNLSEAPPYGVLGNMVGVGVLYAMFASLGLLPILVDKLPVRLVQKPSGGLPKLGFLAIPLQNHGNWILLLGCLIIVSTMAFIPQNELNDDPINFLDNSLTVKQDIDFVSERLTGPVQIHVVVSADGPGGVTDPNYLNVLNQYVQWQNTYPDIVHVSSFSDIIKQLNRTMHGDVDEYYTIPSSKELASQYLLMYEMSLPWGLDLTFQLNHDRSASRIILSAKPLSSNELLALEKSVVDWFAQNAPVYMKPEVTAVSLVFAKMQKRNMKTLLIGFVIALFLISVFLVSMLRSFRLGLISLLPNLAPAGVAFGIWAIISGQIGMGISLGFTMTLGIVVDDTIHFLSKYQWAIQKERKTSFAAIRYALDSVGAAMLVTTIALCTGFLALTLSKFQPNQDVGLITAITLLAAVIIDLLLLPILVMKTHSWFKVTGTKSEEKLEIE